MILDPGIIARSPTRWLAAGICFEILTSLGPVAYAKAQAQHVSSELIEVMDTIFMYAALTSIMGVGAHASAAHGIFDGFTVLDKTRHFGHGLLVGFGNICLLAIEQRPDADLKEAIQVAKACGIPTTLAEIADLTDEELHTVAGAAAATEDMHNCYTGTDSCSHRAGGSLAAIMSSHASGYASLRHFHPFDKSLFLQPINHLTY